MENHDVRNALFWAFNAGIATSEEQLLTICVHRYSEILDYHNVNEADQPDGQEFENGNM